MNELIFLVEPAEEGGYTARSLGASIFTEADTLPDLRRMILDAVRCHFDQHEIPPIIRLHIVQEELLAA